MKGIYAAEARTSRCTSVFFCSTRKTSERLAAGWIAAGAERAHQAFWRYAGCLGQRRKAYGRIDKVTQHHAGGGDVAFDQGLHGFLKQRRAEFRVRFDPGFDVIPEVDGENHIDVTSDESFEPYIRSSASWQSGCLRSGASWRPLGKERDSRAILN